MLAAQQGLLPTRASGLGEAVAERSWQAEGMNRTAQRHSNGWFMPGYAGVGGFLLLEATARERGGAASLTACAADGAPHAASRGRTR